MESPPPGAWASVPQSQLERDVAEQRRPPGERAAMAHELLVRRFDLEFRSQLPPPPVTGPGSTPVAAAPAGRTPGRVGIGGFMMAGVIAFLILLGLFTLIGSGSSTPSVSRGVTCVTPAGDCPIDSSEPVGNPCSCLDGSEVIAGTVAQ
jgi:hypothetical protein